MKCPKCQLENREGAKFCGKCRAKLALICPECKAENPPENSYCDECGTDLKAAKSPSPIDTSAPQSYTPKHLADQILTSRSALEGEHKIVTVLFADVANYTSLSEKLDPEEVHQIMDGCFQILLTEIHRYEGTVNQFTGDGVMALFGAPIAHEDHAQRACHAALAIQTAMADYGEKLKKQYGIDFLMRIGLNSGPVVVGKIGDDLRMDYTAIGDTTNLASRMQGLASPGAILVSSHTYHLVQDFFEFDALGPLEVKGKEEPQEVYQLLRPTEVGTRFEAAVSRGLTRFVGRTNSMATLMEAWEKVLSGAGQVVSIVGEAGVGKSRLLLELRSRIPQGTFTYLQGRCLQYGGAILYLPILDILRSYFGLREGDREPLLQHKLRQKVSYLDEKILVSLPCFQDLLSLKVEDEAYLKLEPKQRRERTFEAVRDLLLRESQVKPLILALEDLHWINKTSEEFLGYLIDWLSNAPILLLLLYRPEYTHPWGSKSYYSHIGLTQLTPQSSAELVQAILEEGEVAPDLRQLLLDRAAGNPLFMEELTHSLLENGSIQKRDHQYILTQKPSEIQVPDTIQGVIAARMDRLDEDHKRTLQTASIIGRDFVFRILQMITGMREDLKSHLRHLQGLAFIHEKSPFPEMEYIFRHVLTQEVAYNSLLLERREEIHQKIAQAIEQLYAERVEEFYEVLAYHYARGEGLEKASQYLKLSGKKAARNHSLWEACTFYKEALATLNRLPETLENKKEKLEVLFLVVTPLWLLGFPEGSLEMLQEGESLSKDLRDNRCLGFFHGRLGAYYTYRGSPLLGVKYSEDALEEGRKSQDIELILPIAQGLCTCYIGTGQYNKVVDIAANILDLLENSGRESDFFAMPVNPYCYFCAYCGVSMGSLGNFEEGKILLEKGLSHGAQIGDSRSLGFVEFCFGLFFHTKGDWKPAIGHLQNSIKCSEEVKYLIVSAWSWALLGDAHSYLGNPETGRKYVEKGLKIQRDSGVEWFLSFYPLFLSDIHFHLGDLKNALSFMDEALRVSQKENDKRTEGISWMRLGRILGRMEAPQIHKAEEYILQGMKILDELKLKPQYALGYFFLGELYADAGQKEKALENLKKGEAMFQKMGMDYWLAQAQATLDQLREGKK